MRELAPAARKRDHATFTQVINLMSVCGLYVFIVQCACYARMPEPIRRSLSRIPDSPSVCPFLLTDNSKVTLRASFRQKRRRDSSASNAIWRAFNRCIYGKPHLRPGFLSATKSRVSMGDYYVDGVKLQGGPSGPGKLLLTLKIVYCCTANVVSGLSAHQPMELHWLSDIVTTSEK